MAMNSHYRSFAVTATRTATFSLLAMGLFAFASLAGARPTSLPLEAIWQVHQVEMTLRSGQVFYSCDALSQKVAAILTEVGVREDVNVQLSCRGSAQTNDATAHITFAAPVPATAENVRRATTYSTETQLVARLNRIALPTANDIDRFPAEWQSVNLTRNRRLRLDAGDCALLRALATQVFPRLDVRIEKPFSCPESLVAHIRPRVQVAALVRSDAPPVILADRQ
jgi:hypothetical protein